MNTTQLEKDNCPSCGKVLDGASPTDGESSPKANDLSVCIHCGAWNRYNEDLKLVKLTQEERDSMPDSLQKEMDEVSAKIAEVKSKLN